MANPKKKSAAAAPEAAPKITRKMILKDRHERNVLKKTINGSVFARARDSLGNLTKTAFRKKVAAFRAINGNAQASQRVAFYS